MSVPASVPAPPVPTPGAPAPTAPPAGGPQPPTPGTPPAPQPPQDGQQQPPAGPPDPNSPENMQERLRRRQAVIDEQADQLRAWRALGASPEAVQQLLAGQQQPPAPGAGDPPVDVDVLRAQIRGEVETEVRTAADRRVVEADVTAALTGRVGVSPAAALALMRDDLAGIRLGGNGHADPLDVEVAVRALLEREPGLAAQAASPPRFQTPADQGPRGGGEPKTLDQQIAEAKAAGNVRLALQLTNRKLTQQA